MYEQFDFTDQVTPAQTCVLANEVSNHLPIYMWDDNARTLLISRRRLCRGNLMSCRHRLRRALDAVGRSQFAGGVHPTSGRNRQHWPRGNLWPPRRRFLTVNFVRPDPPASGERSEYGVSLMPLSTWDASTDTFIAPSPKALDTLAGVLCLTRDELTRTLDDRTVRMEELSQGRGVGMRAMRDAVDAFSPSDDAAKAVDVAENAAD